MEKELIEIIKILKKTLPKLIKNPKIMTGCDISQEEIEDILLTKKLSIEVLHHVAGDRFFEAFNDELGLSEKEAQEISIFLHNTAKDYFSDLKQELPYIKE